MDGERLARMEEKIDVIYRQLNTLLGKHEELVESHSNLNTKVQVMEAKAQSAWWTLVQMGGLTAAVASVVSWAIVKFKINI